MLKTTNYRCNKNEITNFKDIKVFDSLPLRSLDSINSKPKPLFVCCVVYDQDKKKRSQLVISYIYI